MPCEPHLRSWQNQIKIVPSAVGSAMRNQVSPRRLQDGVGTDPTCTDGNMKFVVLVAF